MLTPATRHRQPSEVPHAATTGRGHRHARHNQPRRLLPPQQLRKRDPAKAEQAGQLSRSRILWNFTGDQGRPKDENAITNEIADRLKARLNAPGLLDREVEVTPSRRGIGTRIDLKATVPTSYPAGAASVIIEAKLATNSSLRTNLNNQLVRQYLIPTGCQDGIYLVYWAKPQWPGSPQTGPPSCRNSNGRQPKQATGSTCAPASSTSATSKERPQPADDGQATVPAGNPGGRQPSGPGECRLTSERPGIPSQRAACLPRPGIRHTVRCPRCAEPQAPRGCRRSSEPAGRLTAARALEACPVKRSRLPDTQDMPVGPAPRAAGSQRNPPGLSCRAGLGERGHTAAGGALVGIVGPARYLTHCE